MSFPFDKTQRFQSMSTAPEPFLELAHRFEHNLNDYRSGRYNETQMRREFIDPFFKALGWDVDNEKGYPEAYKDVVHEEAVKVGGATKAPDYGFRIGGVHKFFVEAKKPSINIKDDVHPAYQLQRWYAWSANLRVANLQGAVLAGANLEGANLREASLEFTNLSKFTGTPEDWEQALEWKLH